MKERPILFSPQMVMSIFDFDKRMTRRTTGLDEINEHPDWYWLSAEKYTDKKGRNCYKFFSGKGNKIAICPYGQIGDILWAREKFRIEEAFELDGDYYPENYWYYASTPDKITLTDGDIEDRDNYKWRPSIHMPKKAARIWLKITHIKPQRLHDITDEDIISEGVRIPVNGIGSGKVLLALGEDNTAISFLPAGCLADGAPKVTQSQFLHAYWAELWCKINGRQSYDKNPWVWAISFDVLSKSGKPANI